MSEQYFHGIRKGDKIWTIESGPVEVSEVYSDYFMTTSGHSYSFDGRFSYRDFAQAAFWSDPGIVAPPRPKRYKKVKVEVRPFRTFGGDTSIVFGRSYNLSHKDTDWVGPAQFIEVEIQNDL